MYLKCVCVLVCVRVCVFVNMYLICRCIYITHVHVHLSLSASLSLSLYRLTNACYAAGNARYQQRNMRCARCRQCNIGNPRYR